MVAAKLLSISPPWRLVPDSFEPAWKQRDSLFGRDRNLERAFDAKIVKKAVSRNDFFLFLILYKFVQSLIVPFNFKNE